LALTSNDRIVHEFYTVVEERGGGAVFGHALRSQTDLQAAIREGFPQTVVEEVMHAAWITLKDSPWPWTSRPRSLQRRRREGRLATYESDRLSRWRALLDSPNIIWATARQQPLAQRPNRALGGSTPLEMIDTEPGA
jgi:putative toxin-antitoxin system antitoxin component (TIGR02293 family)